jgi:hypothetical protein
MRSVQSEDWIGATFGFAGLPRELLSACSPLRDQAELGELDLISLARVRIRVRNPV